MLFSSVLRSSSRCIDALLSTQSTRTDLRLPFLFLGPISLSAVGGEAGTRRKKSVSLGVLSPACERGVGVVRGELGLIARCLHSVLFHPFRARTAESALLLRLFRGAGAPLGFEVAQSCSLGGYVAGNSIGKASQRGRLPPLLLLRFLLPVVLARLSRGCASQYNGGIQTLRIPLSGFTRPAQHHAATSPSSTLRRGPRQTGLAEPLSLRRAYVVRSRKMLQKHAL